MNVDIQILYEILRAVASNGRTIHYSDLSREYEKRTGNWLEPHGSWDAPLGEINTLANHHHPQLPPLSAVVTLKKTDGGSEEPGGMFWGSSPGVPSKPRDPTDRLLKWAQILKDVHAANWPPSL